jgi:hypothetical protein
MIRGDSKGCRESGFGSGGLARIVIFAECGLLAGDLTAMLSGRFSVTRATSISGARQALATRPEALIIVEGMDLARNQKLLDLVEASRAESCRVLLLGAQPGSCPSHWTDTVIFLQSMPQPVELFQALNDLPLREAEAEG